MMSKKSRIGQPWFLAAVLALGFGFAWAFAIGMGSTFFGRNDYEYRSVVMLADETLAIESYGSYGSTVYETPDGRPIDKVDETRMPRSVYVSWYVRPDDLTWKERLAMFAQGEPKPTAMWYLIHDKRPDGNAYFEGYDLRSRRRIGYMGLRGFRRDEPPRDEQFRLCGTRGLTGAFVASLKLRGHNRFYENQGGYTSRGPVQVVYLLSDDRLLKIDLREHTVSPLRESDGIRGITGVPWELSKKSPQREVYRGAMLAAWTDSHILLLDKQGKEIRRWGIPKRLPLPWYSFYPLSDTRTVAEFNRRRPRQHVDRTTFIWFDGQGRVEKEQSVDLPARPIVQNSPWFIAAAAPVPVGYGPILLLFKAKEYLGSGESADWPGALAAALADTWPPVVLVTLSGIVLAVVCYRRQKRYNQPWTWVWVVTVLLFGLPGFVGYLFHRRWPAIEPCPSCEALAPRDRPACHVCGQEFPRPARKGTEVFA